MVELSHARVLGLGVAVAVFTAVGCGSSKSQSCVGSSSPLCTGSGRCIAFAACATESDISGAFATVEDGDTLAFAAGTYEFDNELALGTANDVTVIGPGSAQTTLDFHAPAGGRGRDLRAVGATTSPSRGSRSSTRPATASRRSR